MYEIARIEICKKVVSDSMDFNLEFDLGNDSCISLTRQPV